MDKFKCLQILGLNENPSEDEIKAAYRKLAKQWHPDKNPDDPNAKYKFSEVHQAMKTLLDNENEMSKKIIWEYCMRNCFNRYMYTFCSYEDEDEEDFNSFESDDEGDIFFNLVNERRRYTNDRKDNPMKEEERDYEYFHEWKETLKAKRKQKLKESAPVRPKQLKKKQQEHRDYQRDRESAIIREELMNQMEERRIKLEKMSQKEEEKRRQVQEEMKRNLEETVARTNLYTKVKAPKPQVNFKKPKSQATNKREKFKVVSSSSEDNPEATSCNSVGEKNEEYWDSEEPSYCHRSIVINLPTSERVKEERQSKLEDILRKARSMKCVEEWNVTPEEHPQQQTSAFWDSEDEPASQCPSSLFGDDNELSRGYRGGASSEEPHCRRVSPSFWESEEESMPQSATRQSFNDDQMCNEERTRYNEIQKLREMEQRRNSKERDEIRAVESFHRRQIAMEKRQMERSPMKDSRLWTRSTSCNESVTNTAWDRKCRSEENADAAWDSCDEYKIENVSSEPSFLQTENVWNKRMAVQNQRQEIVPSTIDDEEAMLQKAIQLSHIQYVEDEKARYKMFEERAKDKTVSAAESQTLAASSLDYISASHTDFANIKKTSPSSSGCRSQTEVDLVTSDWSSSNAKSQRPSETRRPTSSSLDFIPASHTDFVNIKTTSPSSSVCRSETEDDPATSELFSSSDTNNESQDASTPEEHKNQEFSSFSRANDRTDNRFSTADIEKPVNISQSEVSSALPQVNLNSKKSSLSEVRVDLEQTSSQLPPPVNVKQHSYPSEAFVKVEKPSSVIRSEETSRLQESSVDEDISVVSHEAVNLEQPSSFPKENVTLEHCSINSEGNNFERSSIPPQTNVVNHDWEQSVNISQANTSSELPRPFSEPNKTSSHITHTDMGFKKDFELPAVKHCKAGAITRATIDLGARSPTAINTRSAVPPFPKTSTTVPSGTATSTFPESVPSGTTPSTFYKSAATVPLETETSNLSTVHNVETITVQQPYNPTKMFEQPNNFLGSFHPQENLPFVGDTLPSVSASGNDTSCLPSSALQNSSQPIIQSSGFTITPPTQTVMENQNYFSAMPNAFVPSSSGFPQFPSTPTNGLLNAMPNLFAPPFAFPIHPQLGANGILGYPPQMCTPCSPFGTDWYSSYLPPSYRKLMELPPDTPATSNPFVAAFLPTPNCSNPYAAAMSNPFPASFLPMQNCSNPDPPATSNAFPPVFPPMQNCSNPDRVYTNVRPAESRINVPDESDVDSFQQQLSGCGRGRAFSSRNKESKNVGVEKVIANTTTCGVDKDGESLLGPPPKDIRLRKRWEKQIEAMTKGLTTSNT